MYPEFDVAVKRVISTCNSRNVAVAIHLFDTKLTGKWIQEGAKFVLHSMDTHAMSTSLRRDFEELKTLKNDS